VNGKHRCISLLFVATGMTTYLCPAQTLETLRDVCIPSVPLPVIVAEEHRTFEKYGIKVETRVEPNSTALRNDIGDGRADIANAAVDNDIALVESGAKDVVIVMGGEGSTNELISQPGLRAISSLRGRVLIVDTPETAYALQLKKILLTNGLKANRDYQLKAIGPTPLRLEAMRQDKDYAASIMGVPTSIIAKHDGFVSLGTTETLIGPYQGIGTFVQRQWAREHSKILTAYIAAYIEAQHWLLDPRNREEVLNLLATNWHLSPELSREAYESITGPGGYEKDARLDLDALGNVLKLRADIEGQWQGHVPPMSKYYDLTYYNSALSSLKAVK
jgi:ABC-type nitrate/sulfonate/bicarbonate transport system substrate-binding protein